MNHNSYFMHCLLSAMQELKKIVWLSFAIKYAPEHHEQIIIKNNLNEWKRKMWTNRRAPEHTHAKSVAAAKQYTYIHYRLQIDRHLVFASRCCSACISFECKLVEMRVHLPQIHMTSKREQWDKMYEANIKRRIVAVPTFSKLFVHTRTAVAQMWTHFVLLLLLLLLLLYCDVRVVVSSAKWNCFIFWMAPDRVPHCRRTNS